MTEFSFPYQNDLYCFSFGSIIKNSDPPISFLHIRHLANNIMSWEEYDKYLTICNKQILWNSANSFDIPLTVRQHIEKIYKLQVLFQ